MKDISQLVPDAAAFDRAVVAGLRVAVPLAVKRTVGQARVKHAWKNRSYETAASIDSDARSTSSGAEGEVFAGTIAVYLNDGTRPHVIAARRKKFLRFTQGGAVRFAKSVHHPGTKADPYLESAQDFADADIDRQVGALLDELL